MKFLITECNKNSWIFMIIGIKKCSVVVVVFLNVINLLQIFKNLNVVWNAFIEKQNLPHVNNIVNIILFN